jgi:hypothetical protein
MMLQPRRQPCSEIHSSTTLLKGFQRDAKFQWRPSHYIVVDSEIADYLAKKGTVVSQTFTCKLPFHFAKLKIKRSVQAGLSRYYTARSQHKPWNKMVENKYIIPDLTREDAVATFQLITGHDCLATHLCGLLIYPCPVVSCGKKRTP